MPRKPKELSPLELRRLTDPGLHAVGGVTGLYLNVSDTGARSWILRATIGSKRREMGLGPFPDVGLAEARNLAREAKAVIARGGDPIEERREAMLTLRASQHRGKPFGDVVEEFFYAKKRPELGSDKHARNWLSSVRQHALPSLKSKPTAEIDAQDILNVLEPIWLEKTPTAKRLRQRLEEVFEWAKVHGHYEGENPARWAGHLKEMLPKPDRVSKVVSHPAVALTDLPRWFERVKSIEGMGARALQLVALTAARSGEVRGADWTEIDVKRRLWTISSDRMKAAREHRVPLANAACAVLEATPRFLESDLLFTAHRGGALSDATISKAMKRAHALDLELGGKGFLDHRSGRPAVPHGLRSSFRDWAAEMTDYPAEMAELALAHQVGNEVERAYRRTDMLEKRRQMMEDWAAFLSGAA